MVPLEPLGNADWKVSVAVSSMAEANSIIQTLSTD